VSGALGRATGVALAVWLAAAFPALAETKPGASDADPAREVLVMLRLPAPHVGPDGAYSGGWDDDTGRSARRRAASRLAQDNGLTLVESWPMPLVGVDCFVLEAPPGRKPAEVAAWLSRDPGVAWSQPMNLYRAEGEASHNDPLYPVQPSAREWRLAELHKTTTGRGVRIAVIDSQVEARHPDLDGQVVASQDFAPVRAKGPELHGTAVAGIIAAKADNGIGIAGIAPGARILALRACWPSTAPADPATVCDTLSLAKALEFAVTHDAQVINLSLSGPSDILLGKLIDAAMARRIVVVAAYDRAAAGGGFPAAHPGVVAVADETWGPPPGSAYAAPGHDVPTTTPGGRWGMVSGASFAAAHVSGLVALMGQARPLSAARLKLAVSLPGGAIDACATLLGPARACGGGRAVIREAAAATPRP
jgi:subtilisin family serine protease